MNACTTGNLHGAVLDALTTGLERASHRLICGVMLMIISYTLGNKAILEPTAAGKAIYAPGPPNETE